METEITPIKSNSAPHPNSATCPDIRAIPIGPPIWSADWRPTNTSLM